MNKKIIIALPLLLTGCETIYGWADSAGKHMPTIGEPCRNWQCFTDSGQQKSAETKALEEVADRPPVRKGDVIPPEEVNIPQQGQQAPKPQPKSK